MKLILSSLIIFFSFSILAQEIPDDISRYLATAPAMIKGHITFDEDLTLDSRKVKKGILNVSAVTKLKKDQKVEFSFNNKQFRLDSEAGLEVKLAGLLPINIKTIYYDNEKGRFQVVTDGLAFNQTTQRELEKALNDRFAAKMSQAASRYDEFRNKKNLTEVKTMIAEILNIFKEEGSNLILPSYKVSTTLVTVAPRDQSIKLGALNGLVKKDQRINTTVRHRYNGHSLEITGLVFKSRPGLIVNGTKSNNVFTEATIRGISLSESSGFQVDGSNNLDTTSAIFAILVDQIGTAAGNPPSTNPCNCTVVQEFLDSFTTGKVKEYVRANRSYLRQAGFSNRLLRAIENDNTDAINYHEFFD